MGVTDVRTLGFACHVVNLQRQDRQTVDRPRRGLGIEPGIGPGFHVLVFVEQVRIDIFHHIGTILVRLVDTALDGQCGHGVDLRVADDILQVPLHGVDPVFMV